MRLAHPLNPRPGATPETDARILEICEFVAGGGPPVDADPAFKTRLREHLWQMLSAPESDKRQLASRG